MHLCGYCESQVDIKSRCGKCKIVYYCSKQCQTKHWKLIHKKQCKRFLQNDSNYHHDDVIPKQLFYEWERYRGNDFLLDTKMYRHKLFVNMMMYRMKVKQLETCSEELIFYDINHDLSINKIQTEHILNMQMCIILDAFDKDGDRRLNFAEWSNMLKEITFNNERSIIGLGGIWDAVCSEYKLQKDYSPSMNNGIYGNYFKKSKEIALNARQILTSFGYVAWIKSKRDGEFGEESDEMIYFDLRNDKAKTLEYSFLLLSKLYGHALSVLYIKKDIHIKYQHQLQIGMHSIKFINNSKDQEKFWKIYNNNMYYDLYYLSRRNNNYLNCDEIYFLITICLNKDECTEIVYNKNDKYVGNYEYNQLFKNDQKLIKTNKMRYYLGYLPSYIPNNSFTMKTHAILIGNVLKFHNLNPSLCHSIYIGDDIHCSNMQKSRMIDEFNDLYFNNENLKQDEEYKETIWKRTKIYDYNDNYSIC